MHRLRNLRSVFLAGSGKSPTSRRWDTATLVSLGRPQIASAYEWTEPDAPTMTPVRKSLRRASVQSSGVNAAKRILLVSLFLSAGSAFAQSSEKEPAAIMELGASANRSLTEGQSSFGPTVAVEATPIENWLELEAGVTPLFRRRSTEWSIDLLFQETVDAFGQDGVHARSWPRVDSYERIRYQNGLSCR